MGIARTAYIAHSESIQIPHRRALLSKNIDPGLNARHNDLLFDSITFRTVLLALQHDAR